MKNFKTILVMAITIISANSAFAVCSDAQWAAADAACGSISSNYSAYSCNDGSGGTAQIGCAPDNCLTVNGGTGSSLNTECAQGKGTFTFTIFSRPTAPTKR